MDRSSFSVLFVVSPPLCYHQLQMELIRANYLCGRTTMGIIFLAAVGAIGCSSGKAPLVIHMYNPKTHQALVCSARDQRAGADSSMLAGAVESCAKNLEARGFIREK